MKKRILGLILTISLLISSISFVNVSAEPGVDDYSAAENAVLNAWDNLEDSVDISEFEISIDEVNKFCDYVLSRNVEYFYVTFDSISYYDKTIYGFEFEYFFDKSEIPEMINRFNAKADEILAIIPDGIADEEKLLILHDYLAGTTSYDKRVYTVADYNDKYIRTVYGCIVNKTAVCEGISKAFSYLCGKLGINSYLVTSETMCHQWNMVELYGKYYHIDVTQDAPMYYLGGSDYYQARGDVTHTFFLKSDAQISDQSLGNSVHNDWVSPNSANDSNTYNNAFWNSANGMVNYKNGKYYYIKGADFVEYDYASNSFKKLYSVPRSTWKGSSGQTFVYKGEYSKAVVDSDKNYGYFVSADKVYAYNLDNGDVFDIYTLQGNGFIYALLFENGHIKISVRDNKSGNDGRTVACYSDLSFPVLISDEVALKGDVDGNGKIELSDVLLLYKYLLKTEDQIYVNNTDINCDLKIDMKDVLLLRRLLAD